MPSQHYPEHQFRSKHAPITEDFEPKFQVQSERANMKHILPKYPL